MMDDRGVAPGHQEAALGMSGRKVLRGRLMFQAQTIQRHHRVNLHRPSCYLMLVNN